MLQYKTKKNAPESNLKKHLNSFANRISKIQVIESPILTSFAFYYCGYSVKHSTDLYYGNCVFLDGANKPHRVVFSQNHYCYHSKDFSKIKLYALYTMFKGDNTKPSSVYWGEDIEATRRYILAEIV